MLYFVQLKASGSNVDTNPTLTFTLKSNHGFHAEFFEDHHGTTQLIDMLSLSAAKGKWIQVRIFLEPSTILEIKCPSKRESIHFVIQQSEFDSARGQGILMNWWNVFCAHSNQNAQPQFLAKILLFFYICELIDYAIYWI